MCLWAKNNVLKQVTLTLLSLNIVHTACSLSLQISLGSFNFIFFLLASSNSVLTPSHLLLLLPPVNIVFFYHIKAFSLRLSMLHSALTGFETRLDDVMC